ncbi:DUF3800 domain-containing protein [Ectothiorhodospiraceae bacterium WFHF3C12]|nr:DUF3800 domain-containing protein [Ectothiorhodospiraceae bacterium WFHF3C12]
MSFLLFMDESGQDHKNSPYEVLAGVCIEDRDLWNLICEVQDAETAYFGRRITPGTLELKAKKLLKRKTFKLAAQLPGLAPAERTRLTAACLEKGDRARGTGVVDSGATQEELTALAQAKIAFVEHLIELCARYRARAFASIVDPDAPKPAGNFLRKDYAYLFERYFYFLDEQPGDGVGLVVFDELEKSQSHILVDQMGHYFRETAKGRMRAARVIPEPFFVHSHLTTAIQLADIVAYVVSWGVRFGRMEKWRREELAVLAARILDLRHRAYRGDGDNAQPVWSFAYLDDLRPREERVGQ